ncbi:MAG: beta-glucosidase BglX [Acidobacteriota bacterium]|nr:beta-glucosidase BglX [Acidobacteriota bacterium]
MKIAKLSRSLVAICLVGLLTSATGISQKRHPQPPRASRTRVADSEQRIDVLLSRMTLEEKLGQLQQLGDYSEGTRDLIRRGGLGSTLGIIGAKKTNELQHIAMEESRLKIPLLFAFDVIHGYRTIFPVPLGEASSWDPAAVERSASVAAAEARAAGLHWTFAPMVDIARDARWGRIVEGSGEDPYLGAVMASARVRGFQGRDYSAPDKVIACAKHWVGYGAAEAGRDYNTTDISEWTLREIYFPPYKAALDAGVGTFMSAFNDINGVPASANPFTLTKVLRGEWKFDGFVVSDYESVKEVIQHGLAANEAEAARYGLNAGVDMEMVSKTYSQNVTQLIKDGKVSQSTVDEAVRRVLRIKFRAGLFEKPYTDESLEQAALLSSEHLAAALQVATRSMVLLKNERETLPLSKSVKSIAVIGPLADSQKDMIGSWSGDGRPEDAVTLLTGIKAKLTPQVKIIYAKGCEITGDSTDGFETAVRAARESDVSIIAVGESAEMSGEAASRSSLDLPGRQLDLVKAIHAIGKPYVVVLMNGRPLSVNWIAQNSPAILEAWFAGTQAGPALVDVLFGDQNPGGKLPVTFPRTVGQVPIYYNYKNTGRPQTYDAEGRPQPADKYRSMYLDIPNTPLFPFGYGLSYTQFRFGNLQLSAKSIRPDGRLTVSVEVENTGKRAGDEVVQLYIRDVAASRTRPVKELKGFERVTLQPGERRRVQFILTPEQLGFYNRDMRFVVEPGEFRVFVGASSVGGLEAQFQVTGLGR